MWFNELWQRWMGQAPRQLRRRCRPSRTRTRLTLEALEERTLLSNPATTSDLIAAINSANSSGTPTTITLTANTTFDFTSGYNGTFQALPPITGNITIVGSNDILVRTAPSSTPFRLFAVGSGGSLTLANLTLKGGYVGGPGADAVGGAIFSSGRLFLSGVTVQSNEAIAGSGLNAPTGGGTRGTGGVGAAASGGGLYVAGGSVTLTDDTFSRNFAIGGRGGHGSNHTNKSRGGNGGLGGTAAGGGIYVAGGSFSLSNDTLSGNFAEGGSGGRGGNGSQNSVGGIGGNGGSGLGGGLFVAAAGNLTLSNDTFSRNIAIGGSGGNGGNAGFGGNGGNAGLGHGGGLYVASASSLILSQDTFNSNRAAGGSSAGFGGNGTVAGNGGAGAEGAGGGLYVVTAGSLILSQDTLSNNFAIGGAGGNGGNAANGHGKDGGAGGEGAIGLGGSLVVLEANTTLVNDTLEGNEALGGRGGIGGNGGEGSTEVGFGQGGGNGGVGGTGGAGAGGGLYAAQGSITLLNDTLSINHAGGGAGGTGGNGGLGGFGLFSEGSDGAGGNGGDGNNAEGGGVYQPGNLITFNLANTLIAENSVGEGIGGQGGKGAVTLGGNSGANGANGSNGGFFGPDVAGTVNTSDRDLIGDGSDSNLVNGVNGDQVGTDVSPINPQLGPLQFNGGPTQTMALLANSPAINAGDNNAPGLPATDQRGFPRIVGGIVDIGAFEFGAEPGVSTDGTQLVIIGNASGTSSNNSATVEVNASGGVEAVLNGTTDSFKPGQITSILIALGGGSNTITVLGTPVGVTTDIVSGGSDTVNVGNGTTKYIHGDVNIENAATLTNILVNDSTDTTPHTVTMQNIGTNPIDPGNRDTWGQLSGLLGNGNINYDIRDTAGVTVRGSNGASTYNILNTSVALTIDAGNGNDTVTAGNGNDSLHSTQGRLTINGGDGTNTLNANDSSSATGQRYTLSNTQLGGTDFATITYALMNAIHVTASGSDTLTITAAPAALVTFQGGSGTNTLVGPTATSLTTWSISGVNSGKVGNVSFSNFQNLAGGAASDAFDFTTSTASLSGTINGGGGTNNNNTLSYATLGSSYRVNVKLSSNMAGSATAIGRGFRNINTLVGSTDAANTLQGPNSTNEWIITGNNAGDINTGPIRPFVFTGMAHLVGGTGVDNFRFHSTSSKVLSINGGGAPAGQGDWLKYSEFPSTSTVTVNLATGSATNVNGGAAGAVTGIQNVLGSGTGTNNLVGDAQGNILIGGSGANTLVGGSGSSLLIGGSGHGSITGGSGSDILIAGTTYDARSAAGEDALMAILAELHSADTFAQKVSDIIDGYATDGGSHLNGSNKLTWGGTVRASTGAFTLSGDSSASSSADWFFASLSSTIKDFNDDGVKDEHNNNALGVF